MSSCSLRFSSIMGSAPPQQGQSILVSGARRSTSPVRTVLAARKTGLEILHRWRRRAEVDPEACPRGPDLGELGTR